MPRFRLLRGIHSEGKDKDGKALTYHPGDVFDSKSDLSKPPHNREGSIRFEAVSGGPVEVSDGLDSMTIADLKRYAEEEEIDLGDATKRPEILALCRREASLA